MRLLSLFVLCLFMALPPLHAQTGKDSVTAPGGHFNTSRKRARWMGANYRKEWNTPITVPVINLSKEHGGLTPIKRGGGKQTKSLRLEDPQGRQYTLRSIAKFITSKTLPGDLQSDAAADIVSDGVSASYPYAALSIPILAEAAGIPHGTARIVYIPDDPKLGEYQKDFGNMMALYEERLPDSVEKGFNTDEIVEKMEKDNDNLVDQLALLRIRILDMYVMDLDRHEDQWTWGANDNGKGKTFYPIAKDRDQAFYINQGFLPGIIKGQSLVPQLEGFKAKSKDIRRFNFASRNLDRFFLTELSEQDWRQTAEAFVSKMTDKVIEDALAQQPREIRDISGPKIVAVLKERRKYLVNEVMDYYRFISEIVSVTGSDKKELFDITRGDDGSVMLQVFKVDRNGQQSIKMYDRKFDPTITKEIRLYGFDGDDKFEVHGSNDKIKIRMIGGGGQDVFENQDKSKGGIVYDKKEGDNKITGSFTNKMSKDTLVNSFQRIYYKYNERTPFISGAYNRDDGVFLGVSLKVIRQGFRRVPYKTVHQFSFNRAFATGAFNFRYRNEFIGAFGYRTDFLTDIEIRAPRNTTNFFGYGVNSVFDKTKPKKVDYYRVRYNLGLVSFLVRHRFSDKVMLMAGPTFEYYDLNKEDNVNKNITVSPPPGLNYNTLYHHQLYAGAKATLLVDSRDSKINPQKGLTWETTVRGLYGLNDSSYNLTQLNSSFSFYIKLIPNKLTLANRTNGGTNIGNYEFYQAQYLSGEEDLRGYRKNRFAGKSKFSNQTELRLWLANFHTYLFPASFGVMAFFDAGRVWQDVDNDSKILTGYGAGIWFSPLRRILLSLSYAISKEDKMPVFGFGWRF
jgi:hypothetical protein